MNDERWMAAWRLLTLDITCKHAAELWLDTSGVMSHQAEMRNLWRDASKLADPEHAVPRLWRLMDVISPELQSAVSHWVAHVFERGAPDRNAEFVWATAATGVIATDTDSVTSPWRAPFERLNETYAVRSEALERLIEATDESAWDRAAANEAGFDRDAVLASIGNMCSHNLFAELWEQECASLSSSEIEAASEWAREHAPSRLGQQPFRIPDGGRWRYDLKRYLVARKI